MHATRSNPVAPPLEHAVFRGGVFNLTIRLTMSKHPRVRGGLSTLDLDLSALARDRVGQKTLPLLGSLIDPGAQNADLLFRQRRVLVAVIDGRHLHFLDRAGDIVNDWALLAGPGFDRLIPAAPSFD